MRLELHRLYSMDFQIHDCISAYLFCSSSLNVPHLTVLLSGGREVGYYTFILLHYVSLKPIHQ